MKTNYNRDILDMIELRWRRLWIEAFQAEKGRMHLGPASGYSWFIQEKWLGWLDAGVKGL